MLRCIIVDDEPLVRELLEDNVRQISFLQLVKCCKNSGEATAVLGTHDIDLIFLDVHMGVDNGLDFLRSLQEPPLVIIVTAFEQYALAGFDLHVVDYLLKPFDFTRFLKACQRAETLFKLRYAHADGLSPSLDFFVNVEYKRVKIVVGNIVYVEGLKDYIKIFLSSTQRPILTRMTMKAIEEKLPCRAFVRTHKSFLVAINKIMVIRRDKISVREKEIPVSKLYRKNLNLLTRASGPRHDGR